MLISEVRTAIAAMAKRVGPNADIYASFCDAALDKSALSLSIYPNGLCNEPRFSVFADDLDTLFELGNAEWDKRGNEFIQKLVRTMALRVIEITADFGECTNSQLRGAGFTADQVTAYGAMACAEADKIASTGPFAILELRGANAA